MLIKVPEILNGAMDFDSFYSLYRKEKNPIVMRILFYIFDLYHGLSVPEASKKHRITNETGYKYAKVWRTQGIDGLIPDYSNNGKPSKMTEEQIEIVTKQVRQGKVHNVDDLLNFILKNFKIEYGKDWAYGFFRDLGLKDGIKYPLPRKEKKLPVKKESNRDKEPEIILNNGYECLTYSPTDYFMSFSRRFLLSKQLILLLSYSFLLR